VVNWNIFNKKKALTLFFLPERKKLKDPIPGGSGFGLGTIVFVAVFEGIQWGWSYFKENKKEEEKALTPMPPPEREKEILRKRMPGSYPDGPPKPKL
jgi:hypothetical protein